MKEQVLIIDAPELSDEGAASVSNFLQEFILAFESHYLGQLQRYNNQSRYKLTLNELGEGEDPF